MIIIIERFNYLTLMERGPAVLAGSGLYRDSEMFI